MSFAFLQSFIVKLLKPYKRMSNSCKIMPDVKTSALIPPKGVSKMVLWQPELFNKTIEVPYIDVQEIILNKVKKQFKSYFLKVPNLPNVRNIDQNTNPTINNIATNNIKTDQLIKEKRILLHPDIINSFEDFTSQEKQLLMNDYNVSPQQHFGKVNIQLNHTNYSPSAMIKGKYW